MGMKIKTATGKEMDCTFAGPCQAGILYVCVENISPGEVATIFTTPEETTRLTIIPPEGENTEPEEYNNFTVFVDFFPQGAGYRVGLRRPFVGEI